jgi:hypothetical protein
LPDRTAKQCRERWFNHLSPEVTKCPWTPEEDQILFQEYVKQGAKWAEIAKVLPGRSDNAVKNRWHASISKRVQAGENGEFVLTPGKIRKYVRRKSQGHALGLFGEFSMGAGRDMRGLESDGFELQLLLGIDRDQEFDRFRFGSFERDGSNGLARACESVLGDTGQEFF